MAIDYPKDFLAKLRAVTALRTSSPFCNIGPHASPERGRYGQAAGDLNIGKTACLVCQDMQ